MEKEKQLQELLDEYEKRFGEPFPEDKIVNTELMEGHIKTCLVMNVNAKVKYPGIYGV